MSISFKLAQSVQDLQSICRYEGKSGVTIVVDMNDGETSFAATGDEAGIMAAAAFAIRSIADTRGVKIGRVARQVTKVAKMLPKPATE